MRPFIIAAVLALAASPALAGTTCTPGLTATTPDESQRATREQCQPGDAISFKSNPRRCDGARCTDDGSVSALCQPDGLVLLGSYGIVTCTMKKPAAVARGRQSRT